MRGSVTVLISRVKISAYNNVSRKWQIKASDSITNGARGLIGKRGDTAMRELFYSFK